jgi:hypothetical protein
VDFIAAIPTTLRQISMVLTNFGYRRCRVADARPPF